MRKLILKFFILLGAAIGLLAFMNGGIALRIVMVCSGTNKSPRVAQARGLFCFSAAYLPNTM